jgi:hypothetical protein
MKRGGYVYIITNKTQGTLYIGVTNNLLRRMGEHRRRAGSGFAARYNLTRLVYFEHCPDMQPPQVGAARSDRSLGDHPALGLLAHWRHPPVSITTRLVRERARSGLADVALADIQ